MFPREANCVVVLVLFPLSNVKFCTERRQMASSAMLVRRHGEASV